MMPVDQSDAFLIMILRLTPNLNTRDRLKLIAAVTEQMRNELENAERPPATPIRGIMQGIGPSPSTEDFAEIRRDMVRGSLNEAVPEDATR